MKKIVISILLFDLASAVILFLLGKIMWAFGVGSVSIFLMLGLGNMLSMKNVHSNFRSGNRRHSRWR